MGFFDSTSSSTQVTTLDEQNFSLQDQSAPGVFLTGDTQRHGTSETTVNVTDQGATQAAFDAFNASIDDVLDFGRDVLDYSGAAIGQTVTSIADQSAAAAQQTAAALAGANQISRSDTAETLNTLTKWLAGAAAVSVIAWAYFRGRK